MAKYNKVKWSISVTPLVHHEEVDGSKMAMDVINENIRRNLYSSGKVTSYNGALDDVFINTKVSDGTNGIVNAGSDEGYNGWEDGNHWHVTSNGTQLGWDSGVDLIMVKNTGFLYDLSSDYQISSTKGTSADLVRFILDVSASGSVSGSDVIVAELGIGEAIVLPRVNTGLAYILQSANNHMAVEVTIIGT